MWRNREDVDESETLVENQITDSVASANTLTMGLNAAYGMDQSMLAHSQAHGVLFANMINEQQQFMAAGQAASLKMAADFYGISPEDILPSSD